MSSAAPRRSPRSPQRTGSTVEQVLEAREAASAYRAVSLDRPREDDEDGDGIGASFGVEDPGFANAEDSATIERLMRVLTDREREILRLRFAEDLTQAEIGARVGVSQMHVSRIIRQAINRLRDAAGSMRRTLRRMEHWDLRTVDVQPHQPKILHSARGEARSILINLPAGESLQEHQVHERAYVVVIEGEVDLGGTQRRPRRWPWCSTRTSATPSRPRATRGCCSCWRRGRVTVTPAPATESSGAANRRSRNGRSHGVHGRPRSLKLLRRRPARLGDRSRCARRVQQVLDAVDALHLARLLAEALDPRLVGGAAQVRDAGLDVDRDVALGRVGARGRSRCGRGPPASDRPCPRGGAG